jgi:hypothetical protein
MSKKIFLNLIKPLVRDSINSSGVGFLAHEQLLAIDIDEFAYSFVGWKTHATVTSP